VTVAGWAAAAPCCVMPRSAISARETVFGGCDRRPKGNERPHTSALVARPEWRSRHTLTQAQSSPGRQPGELQMYRKQAEMG
jgi:hypothetical protein